jgi:hypothetical protein
MAKKEAASAVATINERTLNMGIKSIVPHLHAMVV